MSGVPDDAEVGAALQNLANMAIWMHIDHDEVQGQRIVVYLPDGRVVGEAAAFLGAAVIAAEARARAGGGA